MEDVILSALKMAYRKHHLNDQSVGWVELGEALKDALCEFMGDEGFIKWLEKPVKCR